MGKINWLIENKIYISDFGIPYSLKLSSSDGFNQDIGIIKNNKETLLIKKIIWPFYKFFDFITDGFIETETGKLIKKYLKILGDDPTILEVGCGNMNLTKFIPSNYFYNGFDIRLSEFHVRRLLRKKKNKKFNIAIASATEIPVMENSVSLVISTETFEHIPKIDQAIKEIYRVSKSYAFLICSIPNNYCYKYEIKGPHIGHINNWGYNDFILYMKKYGFEFLEGFQKGFWIPIKRIKNSLHLPLSSKNEFYNTNFFYCFKVKK